MYWKGIGRIIFIYVLLICFGLILSACEDEENEGIPTSCVKGLNGVWRFDFVFDLTTHNENISFFVTAQHLKDENMADSCEIYFIDHSLKQNAFSGVIDEDRISLHTAVDKAIWYLEGTINAQADPMTINGTHRIKDFKGTWTATKIPIGPGK